MPARAKKIIQTLLPLTVGVVLIWFALYKNITPQQRQTVFQHISQANPLYITLSLLLGLASHFSRAYRWQLLLNPLGYKTAFFYRINALFVGYLANLGIPRSGELLRASTLSKYQDVTFEHSFGTIVAERFIDLIMLLLFLSIAILLQYDMVTSFLQTNHINPILPLCLGFLFLGLGVFLLKFIEKSQWKIIQRIHRFLIAILNGVKSIKQMPEKKAFIIHTLFIWSCYFLMFYCIKYSINGTEILTTKHLLVGFVTGALAMSTTSGGIGAYPFAVSSIFSFFNLPITTGLAYGWVLWTTQTLLIVISGIIAVILLVLYTKKK